MARGGRLRLPRPRHYAWRWWASQAIRVCTGRARCGAPGTSSAPWAQLLQLEVEAGMAVQTEVDGLLVLPVAQAAVRFGAVVAVLMRVQRLHMGGPGRQRLGVALAVAAQAGFLRYRLRLLGRAVSPHALHAFGGVLTAQRAVVVLALLGLQGSSHEHAQQHSACDDQDAARPTVGVLHFDLLSWGGVCSVACGRAGRVQVAQPVAAALVGHSLATCLPAR